MADWLAGTLVNPKGMTKKVTASVAGGQIAGVAGNMAANLATGGAYAGAPEVPDFGRVGYLGVNADEVALVKTKSGAFKMKVTDEVLARAPRSAITAVVLEKGRVLSRLRIGFAGDVAWEFDIPKGAYKGAERLAAALQA